MTSNPTAEWIYTFDARNNIPRIGRVLIALGRDAADVPITHTWSDIDAKLVLRHPTSEKKSPSIFDWPQWSWRN